MTDDEIVLELRKGNTTVLRYCYKRTLDQVERLVKANGGSSEEAKDLFHDALLVLNNNCRSGAFRLTSSLSTYLYSICKFSLLNQRKKKQKETMIREIYDETTQLQHKTANELAEAIVKALSDLGEKCREILLDYYYGRLSYEEIAENLSYATGQVVRQQKYRCIQQLKEKVNYVYSK